MRLYTTIFKPLQGDDAPMGGRLWIELPRLLVNGGEDTTVGPANAQDCVVWREGGCALFLNDFIDGEKPYRNAVRRSLPPFR